MNKIQITFYMNNSYKNKYYYLEIIDFLLYDKH